MVAGHLPNLQELMLCQNCLKVVVSIQTGCCDLPLHDAYPRSTLQSTAVDVCGGC